MKVQDLKGKFKKPVLKKVHMSADAMLSALLGSKHKVSVDLRANLKQVKKEVKEEKKMTSSRRHHLKSMMLARGVVLLEAEAKQAVELKQRYMEENCAFAEFPSSMQELQDLCKTLHQQIDSVDEQRYDMESKVVKADKEIDDLRMKVQDLKGKFKKPALKKVRMSADDMLQALLGSKHHVSMDLRANLKQVKKEVKDEEKDSVGDWRKNIEDKAGMDGRKKMFEGEA
ncbi:troponin I, fast skeletal muscle-like [Clupea harengus]|uniref:Troponin I, fast skeletal muscle-like n=1 Tax=Clupea harengus TaxID=7950 RepID=A0A6P3W5F2_CLUHA|nr:troponin I, fast skeletal muscle-like [Clupea harengus]